MSGASPTPGGRYVHEESAERCTVVGVEAWPGPERALLQHEDGRAGDVTLTDGQLPAGYTPLPSPKADPPALADACDADAHRFDVEPVDTAPDSVRCERCELTNDVLIDHLGQPVWNRYPARCRFCDRRLRPADDRLFTHDRFVCPDCQGSEWDVYADRPVDALDRHLIVCHDSPLLPGPSDCPGLVRATTDATRRFLPSVRGAARPNRESEACPACGHDHLTVVEPSSDTVERLHRVGVVTVGEGPGHGPAGDAVRGDESASGTEPHTAQPMDSVADLFGDADRARVDGPLTAVSRWTND